MQEAGRIVAQWIQALGMTARIDPHDETSTLDGIVDYALERAASDIHFVPTATGTEVQLRINSEVHALQPPLPGGQAESMLTTLKQLAGISDSSRPVSTGVVTRPIGGRSVVLNISTFPTHRGESVSIRLGQHANLPAFEELDLDADLLARARSALTFRPHGVVLTTGGTGSGKSTTIHMFMAEARRPGQRVMTIEDELAFEIPDVVQAKTTEGFGIAEALDAMRGADCDIALAGQLQTPEEMRAAFTLARGGTLVFSVLDAPDAPGALHRIVNSGVEPAWVCSLLNLVMGQRLLPRSCPDCQRWRPATPEEVERLGLPDPEVEVVTNDGCESCDGRGSRSRALVTELVTMEPSLAAALERGADVHEIREALGPDFRSIDDGIRGHVLTGAVPVGIAMKHIGRRPTLTGGLQAVATAATKDAHLSDPLARLGGTVSIMFTDIVGSTQLTAQLGDDVWMEVLGQHDALVHKQLEAWDGIAVKSVGDGFMAAFGSATAAVRCGLAIQESSTAMLLPDGSPLEVRVGIHAGEPVKDQGDLFGTTVNVAARVTAAAQPGEVLISDLVRALVASTGRFAFGEPRPVELRGLEGSHLLYEVRPG